MIRRAIFRIVVADRTSAAKALDRVVPAKGIVTIEDPRRVARATSIATVVSSTASVLIWVIAILLALGQLGLDLAPLIAGAGIAGVAIGFGAQNLVKDCITGLFMLIEDQYGIGDVVDLGVASGPVERVSLRTTVLRGQDGTVWHVPNGEVRRVGNRTKLFSVAVLDVVDRLRRRPGPDARGGAPRRRGGGGRRALPGRRAGGPRAAGRGVGEPRRRHAAAAGADLTRRPVPPAAGAAGGHQGRPRRRRRGHPAASGRVAPESRARDRPGTPPTRPS